MKDLISIVSAVEGGVKKYESKTLEELKKRRIACVFAGLTLGAVNGIFGSGGGMLAVPALAFLLGFNDKQAHATAIAVVLPLCAVSAIMYFFGGGSFDMKTVTFTSVGVFFGGILGAKLLDKLPSNALSTLFYLIMLFAGIRMAI